MKKVGVWLIIVLVALVCVSSGMAEEVAFSEDFSSTGWNGTWESKTDILNLIQDGIIVGGSYVPMDNTMDDPGIIEGLVSVDGKTLTGTWYESGPFTFILSDDEMYFNGTYGNMETPLVDDPNGWNGTRSIEENLDIETDWNGIWESEFYKLNFIQDGEIVSGSYEPVNPELYDSGVLSGNLSEDGTVLSGIWIENGGFRFTLSDNGTVFNGTYGYGDSVNAGDYFTWNGTRIL